MHRVSVACSMNSYSDNLPANASLAVLSIVYYLERAMLEERSEAVFTQTHPPAY